MHFVFKTSTTKRTLKNSNPALGISELVSLNFGNPESEAHQQISQMFIDQRDRPESPVSGIMLWSLRSHARNGGFYHHQEIGGYESYHFPGFGPDEQRIMGIMRNGNLQSSVFSQSIAPNLFTPKPTEDKKLRLVFRGSPGAQYYKLTYSVDGEFTRLNDRIYDYRTPGSALYSLDLTPFRSGSTLSLTIESSNGLASNLVSITIP